MPRSFCSIWRKKTGHGFRRMSTDLKKLIRVSRETVAVVSEPAPLPLSCLCRLRVAHPMAHRELHLASRFVGVDNYMVTVQHFPIQDLQSQRVLHQLLNCTLQGPRSEVRIVAFGEQELARGIGEFQRNLALSEQPPQVFQP